ncbi:MAG: hypothetical protein WC806_03230 [Candidatus Gracilibacteria bacterium]|jgi:hypothetical protein
MKKIIIYIIVSFLLSLSQAALAADANPKINDVFQKTTDSVRKTTEAVKNLPDVQSIPQAIGTLIKFALKWATFLVLISIVFAGIIYILGMGQDEDIGKAKNIFINLIIGLIIMSASYALVVGVSKFNVFGTTQ